MKIRCSHRCIWFGRGPFVVLLILSLLSLSAPRASAQTQNQSRQLQRQTDTVNTWPNKAKRWALVIGVGEYRDAQINALKGSVNDANNLASSLVRYAGFPQDQVIVLTTDQPEERQPTRINILTYLSNLASLVPKDGLLLVSFAGHGIERGGQAYLIPSDARLSRDVSLLEESAVSVTRMHDRIKAIGVGQVMVLLDACRNDPGGRAGAPNNMSAAYAKFNFDVRNREVQAFATFYATAIGQRAYEYTEKRQGYFTWAIVEALQGGAANDKGEVTLSALVKYVQDNVPKRIAIDLGSNEQQKPFATIEGYRADELVIAVIGPNAGNTGNATTAATTDPSALEMSFWESIKNSADPADFQAYLEKYPNGQFAALARNSLRRLEAKSKPAVNTQPVENTSSGNVTSLTHTNPKLAFARQESFQVNARTYIRYYLNVTNRAAYQNELFAPAPHLPPCGRNTNSSRSWVDIFDGAGKRLNGFCALQSPDQLVDLWFALPEGEAPPSSVFIVLTDRSTNAQYKSTLAMIP